METGEIELRFEIGWTCSASSHCFLVVYARDIAEISTFRKYFDPSKTLIFRPVDKVVYKKQLFSLTALISILR